MSVSRGIYELVPEGGLRRVRDASIFAEVDGLLQVMLRDDGDFLTMGMAQFTALSGWLPVFEYAILYADDWRGDADKLALTVRSDGRVSGTLAGKFSLRGTMHDRFVTSGDVSLPSMVSLVFPYVGTAHAANSATQRDFVKFARRWTCGMATELEEAQETFDDDFLSASYLATMSWDEEQRSGFMGTREQVHKLVLRAFHLWYNIAHEAGMGWRHDTTRWVAGMDDDEYDRFVEQWGMPAKMEALWSGVLLEDILA